MPISEIFGYYDEVTGLNGWQTIIQLVCVLVVVVTVVLAAKGRR